MINDIVDTFIKLNTAGKILELCETVYADDVQMFNDGLIFASSKKEAFEKQAGYANSITECHIELISKEIKENEAILVFRYDMKTNEQEMNFVGQHKIYVDNDKIVKEEYVGLS